MTHQINHRCFQTRLYTLIQQITSKSAIRKFHQFWQFECFVGKTKLPRVVEDSLHSPYRNAFARNRTCRPLVFSRSGKTQHSADVHWMGALHNTHSLIHSSHQFTVDTQQICIYTLRNSPIFSQLATRVFRFGIVLFSRFVSHSVCTIFCEPLVVAVIVLLLHSVCGKSAEPRRFVCVNYCNSKGENIVNLDTCALAYNVLIIHNNQRTIVGFRLYRFEVGVFIHSI